MLAPETVADGIASQATPKRLFLPQAARARIDRVARTRDALGREPLQLVASFSFKTNPRSELLALARDAGFFAETISRDEVAWAFHNGFKAGRTIYNGPVPLSARPGAEPLGAVFADSVEAFVSNRERGLARMDGIRMRPSMIASRFGVPVEDEPELLAAVAADPHDRPLAISFHARREDFKGASWRDVAGDVVERAMALELRTGRRVCAFDVGGGWTPEEFDASFESDMAWVVERIVASLPACTQLFFEPGQAVCTPTEVLLSAVIEVRRRRGRQEVIADLGYPDWPQMHEFAHPIFVWRDARWQPVGHGPDRLGGRTCLEYDLVEGLQFPPDVTAGDRLLITDVGAYDHSMAFDFARGLSGDART